MTKRWLAAALWLFAGWYVGNFITAFTGLSPLLGPALGTALAVLFAGDPFHVIWPRPARAVQATPDAPAAGARGDLTTDRRPHGRRFARFRPGRSRRRGAARGAGRARP